MSVKILTEQHLGFLSLKLGSTGSSESTVVKMPHCCKSHVTAHFYSFSVKYRVMIYHCERKSIKDMIYSTPDSRSDGDDLELSHPTDEKT